MPKGRVTIPISPEKIKILETSILCPHCKAICHFKPLCQAWDGDMEWTIQKCDGCGKFILAVYQSSGFVAESPLGGYVPDLVKEPSQVYPYFIPTYHKSIPKEIGNDYVEALLSYSVGAYNASATMCRRAIQSSAIERGADPKKKLSKQIEELRDNHIIEPSLAEWADEIRLIGNVPGAHPDVRTFRGVTKEECKEMTDFLESWLEYVYEKPWKIQQRKAKRARKA